VPAPTANMLSSNTDSDIIVSGISQSLAGAVSCPQTNQSAVKCFFVMFMHRIEMFVVQFIARL